MRRRIRKPNTATVLALCALFAALGGTAVAAKRYVITSTRQIKPNVLAALHGQRGARGQAGAVGPVGKEGPAGHEGQQGPVGHEGQQGPQGLRGEKGDEGGTGPKGERGERGPSGEAATKLWAVVDNQGKLVRSSRASETAVLKNSKGEQVGVEVAFEIDVVGCAYEATVEGDKGANTPVIGIANVASGAKPNSVDVFTADEVGAKAMRSFHLAVFC